MIIINKIIENKNIIVNKFKIKLIYKKETCISILIVNYLFI